MRTGLLLDPTGEFSATIDRLALPEWFFQTVSTVEAAHRAISTRAPLVGLMFFDSRKAWPMRDIESLVAVSGIEWIAILGTEAQRAANIRPTVLRSFLDFHTLPIDRQRLLITLGHAHGKVSMCNSMLEQRQDMGCCGMIGKSAKMQELYRQIEKVSQVDAPVLIGGESGTGKELVARAIHLQSDRKDAPFVAMNCGAISPNLIHSELFGHERGAFTGAHQRKIGNIEAAQHGILFLDEIGDLPLDLQASLLRFLQERTIVRVGSTERIRVEARVIAATHVDLHRGVSEGRFREDLYYRLNVLHLKVPPLRERTSDLPMLTNCIFNDREHYPRSPQVRGFSMEALQAIHEYKWPGNVRELINRVQQAMIMTENRLITAADLGLPLPAGNGPTLDEVRASVEKEFIESTLQKHQNNISEVSRQLGISRVTLYRLINRLKIVL